MSASRFARAMSASRRTLDRLDVDQTLVAKLENRGCRTAEDALHRAPLDVVELADCSHRRARDFIISVAKAVAPTPTTAFDALRRSKFVPTTLGEIDAALGGGLSVGSVTEVVGAAGAEDATMFGCVRERGGAGGVRWMRWGRHLHRRGA